jgi:hypothetical protein
VGFLHAISLPPASNGYVARRYIYVYYIILVKVGLEWSEGTS